MKQFFLTENYFLENLSHFVDIFLLGGLWLSFRQLLLIKDDIRIRNERASKEKAIEACDRYFSQAIPLINNLYKLYKEKSLSSYTGPVTDFSLNSIPKIEIKEFSKKTALSEDISATLNQIESIAAAFTSGVADEQTGFKIIGRTFCYSIMQHYDLISICRTQPAQEYWFNIVNLYQLWNPRLTKAELEVERDKMNKRISEL